MPDQTGKAYDKLLQRTGGTGTRQEMGTVRKDGFRKPKDKQ
jgi:hypothetical protein